MSEEVGAKAPHKRKLGRSPSYPNFNIEKALEKVKALHEAEGDYAAPISSATNAWGYSAKSSAARQALATLRYYGLIDILGDGDARKVKVSDTARRILLDRREDQTEKKQLIRRAALHPAVHKTLYDRYSSGLASDGSVIHFLVFDEAFNEAAAKELLEEFKETAKFVGLFEPSTILEEADGDGLETGSSWAPQDIKIGDRIQWNNQGADQFRNGALVIGFSDDGQWLFTDQGSSGIPIRETKVIEHTSSTPPAIPPHLLQRTHNTDTEGSSSGFRKAVFPVEDGDVTLIYPEDISADGLEELGQYLAIFLSKEKRKKTLAE